MFVCVCVPWLLAPCAAACWPETGFPPALSHVLGSVCSVLPSPRCVLAILTPQFSPYVVPYTDNEGGGHQDDQRKPPMTKHVFEVSKLVLRQLYALICYRGSFIASP